MLSFLNLAAYAVPTAWDKVDATGLDRAHHVPFPEPPVRSHLPSLVGVVGVAHQLVDQRLHRNPSDEAHARVPVRLVHPVAAVERPGAANLTGLLSVGLDEEAYPSLSLQQHHPLVESPDRQHVPEHPSRSSSGRSGSSLLSYSPSGLTTCNISIPEGLGCTRRFSLR